MKVNEQDITSFDGETLSCKIISNNQKIKQFFFLSHGIGGSKNAMIPLAKAIVETIPNSAAIVYDLRGHGLSSKKFNLSRIEDNLLADLNAIIEFFGPQKFYLVGHSLGGLISQRYLLINKNPKLAKIFLISAPVGEKSLSFGRKFWYQFLKKNHSKTKKQRNTAQFLKMKNTIDFSPARILQDLYFTGPLYWLLFYLSVFGLTNKNIKKINNQQTIIFYGKKDLLVPKRAVEKFLKNNRKIKDYCFNTNHHQPPLLIPEQIAQKINDLL